MQKAEMGGSQFEVSLGKKNLSENLSRKSKLSMTVLSCNSSCIGSVSRRMVVQGKNIMPNLEKKLKPKGPAT
jgi:hypothetical protein